LILKLIDLENTTVARSYDNNEQELFVTILMERADNCRYIKKTDYESFSKLSIMQITRPRMP
jgi:hypothetical protein